MILIFILCGAAYFRVGVGFHWDLNQHLHPDERFLTMVTEKIRFPSNIWDYFNSATSTLNPYNNDFTFFVYGTFPIFFTRAVGALVNMTAYWDVYLVGRVVATIFDLGSIVLVYLFASTLISRAAGLWAAALLALTAQNIQLSHFYGVENFVSFFLLLAFYLSLGFSPAYRSAKSNDLMDHWRAFFVGLFVGLALACKISSVYVAPFIALTICLGIFDRNELNTTNKIRIIGIIGVIVAISTLIAFRIFQPYAFNGPTPFNLTLTSQFSKNMEEVKSMMNGGDFPPSIQWVDRTPILFCLWNMFRWQMGPVLFIAVWGGLLFGIYTIVIKKRWSHIPWIAWTLFWFLFQSTQFVKAGRYFSTIYPFFAVAAGWFCFKLQTATLRKFQSHSLSYVLAGIPLIFTLAWTIAVTNIYRKPHTRIEASRWMYQNIPCGKTIANEHWDDALPLRIDGNDPFNNCYRWQEFEHYLFDDRKKLEKTLSILKQTDYIVLSSNRLYLSIPRLPKRFPFTIEFYRMLFSGELGFSLVKTSTSYPTLFGYEFPDNHLEETLTVYDHPKVLIFQKSPNFNYEYIAKKLRAFPDGIYEPLVKKNG